MECRRDGVLEYGVMKLKPSRELNPEIIIIYSDFNALIERLAGGSFKAGLSRSILYEQ